MDVLLNKQFQAIKGALWPIFKAAKETKQKAYFRRCKHLVKRKELLVFHLEVRKLCADLGD